VHHMSSTTDNDALVVCDRCIAFLLVRPAHLAALLTIDDEHRTFDPPQKFERLSRIERLGRRGAVERIEFPDPLASIVLFHRDASEL